MLTAPVLMKEPPLPIPKPLPRLPPVPAAKVTPPLDVPKIKVPDVKLPDIPKPQTVHMDQPAPVIAPAAPKRIIAPPAPQVVSLARPAAAAMVNNSPHPAPVALGQSNNPIAPSVRPATSAVNLGQSGMPGMASSNTGSGPHATAVSLGSGSPGGQNMTANSAHAVQGVRLGLANSTGTANATNRAPAQVNLGQSVAPATPKPAAQAAVGQSAPKVLYKPTPVYTAEAAALHLSGAVAIRIRVSATGTVTVLEITSPLGHGLDQSAERAIEGTRFAPARSPDGRPTDWEGVVLVNFQLAG